MISIRENMASDQTFNSDPSSFEAKSTVQDNSKSVDCLACRFTSGFGVIGAGLYVGYHGRKQPIVGKMILSSVSLALCCLGTCRLLNLPPFGHRNRTSPSQQL